MKICPNCSSENAEENQFCVSCGVHLHAVDSPIQATGAIVAPPMGKSLPTTIPPRSMANQQPPPITGQAPPFSKVLPPQARQKPSYGQNELAAMILGIISLSVCACIAPVPAIIAIVLASNAKNDPNANQTMVKVGFITAFIGIGIFVVNILRVVLGFK